MSYETKELGAAIASQPKEEMAIIGSIIIAAGILWIVFSLIRPVNAPSQEEYDSIDSMPKEELIKLRKHALSIVNDIPATSEVPVKDKKQTISPLGEYHDPGGAFAIRSDKFMMIPSDDRESVTPEKSLLSDNDDIS